MSLKLFSCHHAEDKNKKANGTKSSKSHRHRFHLFMHKVGHGLADCIDACADGDDDDFIILNGVGIDL